MSRNTLSGHALAAIAVLTAVVLAGCGSSSSPSTGNRDASASSSSTTTTSSTPGAAVKGAKASTSKAGGTTSGDTHTGTTTKTRSTSSSTSISAFREQASLHKAVRVYASCLDQHGIKAPKPNTTGHGPIINTKGIDVNSPLYKRVSVICHKAAVKTLHAAEKEG